MTEKILLLTITLVILLLIGLFGLIYLNKLKKKNFELSIYESTLLVELRQTEREQKLTKIIIEKLTGWITESYIETTKKNTYIQQLSELDIDLMEQSYLTANEKISKMDMKYIICFAINMDVKDMSVLFNVEPASIRSVRYRIKKKFGEKNTFNFLM